MRINNAGSVDINLLQSDEITYRNQDYVVSQGGAFYDGTSVGGDTSKYTTLQLYNPAGSGKILIIDSIFFSTAANATVSVAQYATEQANDIRAWRSALFGGSAGVSHLRWAQHASVTGSVITTVYLLATTPFQLVEDNPIQVGATNSIQIISETANVGLTANFIGREV